MTPAVVTLPSCWFQGWLDDHNLQYLHSVLIGHGAAFAWSMLIM